MHVQEVNQGLGICPEYWHGQRQGEKQEDKKLSKGLMCPDARIPFLCGSVVRCAAVTRASSSGPHYSLSSTVALL